MELHDDKNGVKDRILDDLGKSIKLYFLMISFLMRSPVELLIKGAALCCVWI